ncbi:Inositol hexakisphosphate and diphosphoinositol-pentakisphosphate kinase [Parelaphostrongylus tenuis]|uniref:Inositol hexakisphosphate and diphosphoinositol-pentakisphosphate kinase n=1 Tax=Parelaphostrongylus tenuis TaxID=148309 RepID=A0AAD5QT88_PARTN|nr:Inositol hexakisphosphate and diphosphoinositol-pentakisphosphate kinase [Parelaphostrongylus tenuis]
MFVEARIVEHGMAGKRVDRLIEDDVGAEKRFQSDSLPVYSEVMLEPKSIHNKEEKVVDRQHKSAVGSPEIRLLAKKSLVPFLDYYDLFVGNVTIGTPGVAIGKKDFIYVTEADDSLFFMPFDGILGLGRSTITVGGVTSPLKSILPRLDAPVFTIWMNKQMVSDTGSSWIGAPTEIIEAVVNQTGALYDSVNRFYTVNCSTIMTQPDLVFTINGVKYNLPPNEYILDIDVGGDQRRRKSLVSVVAILSSLPFMRNTCRPIEELSTFNIFPKASRRHE